MSVVEQAAPTEAPVHTNEERARILEAAALEIEVRGWTQGLTRNSDGQVCMLGAIGLALGLTPYVHDIFGPAEVVFGGLPSPFLTDWNDECPGRAAEEVTFVLRWRAQELRDA